MSFGITYALLIGMKHITRKQMRRLARSKGMSKRASGWLVSFLEIGALVEFTWAGVAYGPFSIIG